MCSWREITQASQKYPMLVGNDLGVGEETCVLDNGASKLMTPNSDFMFNYRQHSGNVRTAGGRWLLIEESDSVKVDIRSEKGMVPLHLTSVLHVPSLCDNLLPLRVLADKGHTYVGNQHGIMLNLKSGRTLFVPSCGRLNLLSVYVSLNLMALFLQPLLPGQYAPHRRSISISFTSSMATLTRDCCVRRRRT